MKKIFTPKSKAIAIIVSISGGVLLAFQNFTPHISKKPSDVSDLYMNSALSTALKTKEEKKPKDMASNREISWEDSSAEKPEHQDRQPASNEETTSTEE